MRRKIPRSARDDDIDGLLDRGHLRGAKRGEGLSVIPSESSMSSKKRPAMPSSDTVLKQIEKEVWTAALSRYKHAVIIWIVGAPMLRLKGS